VGMAVLVGVRVKAKVRALARRDAHSFLAVRAYAQRVKQSDANNRRRKLV